MKVLVALDGSAHSPLVVSALKRMPWPQDARFLVLSVAPLAVNAYVATEIGGGQLAGDLQREELSAHGETTVSAERELREAGMTVESRVEIGDPRDLILRVAEHEAVDVIVIGSHGHHGIARLLVGSVAEFVATHARCSVLIVRPGA